MKRSEMIKHINEFLEEGIGKPDYSGKRILASQFLSFLESKGMLPPAYEKKTQIRVMPQNDVWTSKKPVNEWEPENESE